MNFPFWKNFIIIRVKILKKSVESQIPTNMFFMCLLYNLHFITLFYYSFYCSIAVVPISPNYSPPSYPPPPPTFNPPLSFCFVYGSFILLLVQDVREGFFKSVLLTYGSCSLDWTFLFSWDMSFMLQSSSSFILHDSMQGMATNETHFVNFKLLMLCQFF